MDRTSVARAKGVRGAAPAQHGSRTMHEQAPDIAIPALRYPPQSVLAATRVLPGHQTESGRELSARALIPNALARAAVFRHGMRVFFALDAGVLGFLMRVGELIFLG